MWHEARKQEKKIREAVVDFQKRAERRRQHYAKLRRDPMQLLRVYGTKCTLHLNPTASKMSNSMIPWQGDDSNMISRYDVRVNLDYIPDYSKLPRQTKSVSDEWEEQRCNYERYRFLVLNQFKRVSEQDALASIEVSEMYLVPGRPSGSSFRDKAKSQAKAAIGYRYSDREERGGGGGGESNQAKRDEQLLAEYLGEGEEEEKAFSSESEYEVDVDVDCYGSAEVDKLNVMALEYGIATSSFSRNLRSEKQHMAEAKLARLSDIEKSSLPGKRARRERRQMQERSHVSRLSTPPTYAQRDSPTYEPYEPEHRNRSSSRSSSPAEGQVEFITEFGEGEGVVNQPSNHTHQSSDNTVHERQGRERWRERGRGRRDEERRSSRYHSRSPRRRSSHHSRFRDSRSRSRSRDRPHHSRSHRSSPSHERGRERREERSRSRSRDRSHAHQSSSSNADATSTTPTLKNKLPPKSKSTANPVKEKGKQTPQERLKKRMQAQLSRQFKQDKKIQKEKEHKKETERIEREEEMRDKMRKIRGRERSQWDRDDRWSRSPSPYGYTSHDRYQ